MSNQNDSELIKAISEYEKKRSDLEEDVRYAPFLKGTKIQGVHTVPTVESRRKQDIQHALDEQHALTVAASGVAITLLVAGVAVGILAARYK